MKINRAKKEYNEYQVGDEIEVDGVVYEIGMIGKERETGKNGIKVVPLYGRRMSGRVVYMVPVFSNGLIGNVVSTGTKVNR